MPTITCYINIFLKEQNIGTVFWATVIGASNSLPPPSFPKDDSIVSKGNTPEKKGAGPCRFCGSAKHWDNDCRHSRSGLKQVQAQLAHPDEEYLYTQTEYEAAYLDYSSNDNKLPTIEEEDAYTDNHDGILCEGLLMITVQSDSLTCTYDISWSGHYHHQVISNCY